MGRTKLTPKEMRKYWVSCFPNYTDSDKYESSNSIAVEEKLLKALSKEHGVYAVLAAMPKAQMAGIKSIKSFAGEFDSRWSSDFPELEYNVRTCGGEQQKKLWQEFQSLERAWFPTAEISSRKEELRRELEIWLSGLV